ncbi:hypothetical protein EQO05_11125 [Methanosarcina sp. MSH10X1]|uniref:hypothetical protein n=1 Tax=Methanosarcina sp. MSH10X1 TaxID=2507075 RepID=UPI000FFB585B|nr:hypothetical protein [Methanosarcina sp. MSH10X1]RXA18265.1 hypothetical protein EQO05_11125 [Methanosarcina sp. MSH10X1]
MLKRRNKRMNIYTWLMLIFCVSLFLCGSAGADDSKLNDSGSDEISDSIKEFVNDPSFIAYRGNLPEIVDQEWENSIADCWLNLTLMGPSYSEFDSSIKSVASNNKVIIVELGSAYKGKIDDSRIDRVYQKIEDFCEEQEGISDIPVVFMWAQDEKNLPLPDYGPESFERAKNETGFITTRGTMPVITDADEKVEWTDLLVKCSQPLSRPNSNTGISPYFTEFGGPVNSFGTNIYGYLIVGFEESTPEKVNESVIDEIYQVIDEHFEQEGISDVPVVFIFVQITDDLAPADEPDVNEADDINVSNNEEGIAGNKTTNQMPGFTSIMVILGILSLLVFKRS